MKTLLITLLILVSGCSNIEEGPVESNTFKVYTQNKTPSPELKQYLTSFNYHTGFNTNINIRYTTASESMTGNTIGVCFYGKNLIVIDSELKDGPEVYIQWVIYHELLHCTLGLGHSDNPKSLLYDSYTGENLRFLLDDPAAALQFSIEEQI